MNRIRCYCGGNVCAGAGCDNAEIIAAAMRAVERGGKAETGEQIRDRIRRARARGGE